MLPTEETFSATALLIATITTLPTGPVPTQTPPELPPTSDSTVPPSAILFCLLSLAFLGLSQPPAGSFSFAKNSTSLRVSPLFALLDTIFLLDLYLRFDPSYSRLKALRRIASLRYSQENTIHVYRKPYPWDRPPDAQRPWEYFPFTELEDKNATLYAKTAGLQWPPPEAALRSDVRIRLVLAILPLLGFIKLCGFRGPNSGIEIAIAAIYLVSMTVNEAVLYVAGTASLLPLHRPDIDYVVIRSGTGARLYRWISRLVHLTQTWPVVCIATAQLHRLVFVRICNVSGMTHTFTERLVPWVDTNIMVPVVGYTFSLCFFPAWFGVFCVVISGAGCGGFRPSSADICGLFMGSMWLTLLTGLLVPFVPFLVYIVACVVWTIMVYGAVAGALYWGFFAAPAVFLFPPCGIWKRLRNWQMLRRSQRIFVVQMVVNAVVYYYGFFEGWRTSKDPWTEELG